MKMFIGDVQSAAVSVHASSPSVSQALILSSSKSVRFISVEPGSTRTIAAQLRSYPDATPSAVSVAPARVPGSDQDEASGSPVETYPSPPEVLS
jgi:hypothetical protein